MKYSYGATAIFQAALLLSGMTGAVAFGLETDQREYKTILEITPDDMAAGPPAGWTFIDGDETALDTIPADAETWGEDEDAQAFSIAPQSTPVTLLSPPLPLEPACVAVSGVILGAGANEVAATLRWLENNVTAQTESWREPPVSSDSRRRFNLAETEAPEGADGARVALTVYPEDAAGFRLESIRLMGVFSSKPEVAMFHNKVGYEQVGPKSFVVSANFRSDKAAFSLVDAFGTTVYSGDLSRTTRIQGADGAEWDGYYHRGDFSALQEEGEFTLTVELDHGAPVTAPIRIGFNVLWEEAFAPALAPFKRLRAPVSDNSTLQLWNATFTGDASDAALLWDIVRSWSILRGRFQDTPAFAPLHEEALYGLERLAHWINDGNAAAITSKRDETLFAASLACGARFHPDSEAIRNAARQLAERIMTANRACPLCFSVAMDLYATTQENRYLEYARIIFPGVSTERVETLLDYEGYTGAFITPALGNLFEGIAEQVVTHADNPFGLPLQTEAAGRGFFVWNADAQDPLRGANTRLLATAEIMAQAQRYAANPQFREFVHDQINWLLGNNPYGVCMVVGLCDGDASPPVVLPAGMTRDDLYGAVLHGIGPRAADDDRYHFDMGNTGAVNESTNGFSLYNNARYISALAYLKRIPVARPRSAAS